MQATTHSKKPFLKTALVLTLTLSALQAIAEIYRVVDQDGNVSYTDQPPPNSAAENIAPTLQEAEKRNTVPSPETQRANDPDWVKEVREQRKQQAKTKAVEEDQYQEKLKQWRKKIRSAEASLKKAIKAQQKGIEAVGGDFIGKAGGGARPSASYLKRQETLAKNVKNAKDALAKLKREKPRRPSTP